MEDNHSDGAAEPVINKDDGTSRATRRRVVENGSECISEKEHVPAAAPLTEVTQAIEQATPPPESENDMAELCVDKESVIKESRDDSLSRNKKQQEEEQSEMNQQSQEEEYSEMQQEKTHKHGDSTGFLTSLMVKAYQDLLGSQQTRRSSSGKKNEGHDEHENIMNMTFEPDPYARPFGEKHDMPLDEDPERLRGLIKKLNAIQAEDDQKEDAYTPQTSSVNDDNVPQQQHQHEESSDEYAAAAADDDDTSSSVLLCDFIIIAKGETDPKWVHVARRLQSMTPAQAKEAVEARQGHYYTTPLHLACRRRPPLNVIRDLIKASPQVLSWGDRNGIHSKWLPLHCAAEYRASLPVIQELVRWHPRAKTVPSFRGNTPLHLSCTFEHYCNDMPSAQVMETLSDDEVVTCLNKKGLTPLDVFLRSVGFVRIRNNERDRKECLDCMRMLVRRTPLETSGKHMIASFRISPQWLVDDALSLREVQQLLNDKMNDPLPVGLLMADFYSHIMLIVSYTIVANAEITARFHEDEDFTRNMWYVALFLPNAYMGLREVIHMYTQGVFEWLSNPWNWFNGVLDVLVLVSGILLATGNGNDKKVQALVTATGGLVWLAALAFLKATYLPFSVFISGVIHAFWALIPFIVSVVFVMGAFATMYFISTVGTESCDGDYLLEGSAFCKYGDSWLQVYSMLVSGFADFFFNNGGVQDRPGVPQEHYNQGVLVISLIYAFLVAMLIPTILIAVVGDAWSNVRRRGAIVFWSHRFAFVAEVERIRVVMPERAGWCGMCRREKDDDEVTSSRKTDSNQGEKWQLFWELVHLTYSNHYDGSVVWEEIEKLEQFPWVCRYFGYQDRLDWRTIESSLWRRRIAFSLPVLLWMLGGALTFGRLWPKPVRAGLFCPKVADREDMNAPAIVEAQSGPTPNRDADVELVDAKLEELANKLLQEMSSLRMQVTQDMGRLQKQLAKTQQHGTS